MNLPDSYTRAAAVTTSDSTVVRAKAFYVGGAGNVAIKTHEGATAVTLNGCLAGHVYRIEAYNIMATNTTATNIVALY